VGGNLKSRISAVWAAKVASVATEATNNARRVGSISPASAAEGSIRKNMPPSRPLLDQPKIERAITSRRQLAQLSQSNCLDKNELKLVMVATRNQTDEVSKNIPGE